jgi:hypothetical protein
LIHARCEAERWKSEPNLNSKFQIRRQQADDIGPANFLPKGVGSLSTDSSGIKL